MTATTLTRESLLKVAAVRREIDQLSYFGALSPQEAAALLTVDPQARLADVCMCAEFDWVGTPDISSGQFVHVEWNQYPGGARNANFLSAFEVAVPEDAPVPFLRRSAARSKYAATAAVQVGYAATMNVLEGFEGARDTEGHRKTVEGWCFRGLPWHGA